MRPEPPPHGIYSKYEVRRIDGRSALGEKHESCVHFVLDLTHDEHAIPAIRAYAKSCADEYPALARDLREIAEAHASRPRCHCREAFCPHSLVQALHQDASETAARLMGQAAPRAPKTPETHPEPHGEPTADPRELPLHVIDQEGQPYGSTRRCCNRCGVMVHPGMRLVTSMAEWTASKETRCDAKVP